MNQNPKKSSNEAMHHPASGGFTLSELVVVLALSAVVVGMAVMSYRAIGGSVMSYSTAGDVEIGTAANQLFYGDNNPLVTTYFAPNYGRMILAERLKERFYEDLSQASAVFALGRNGLNTDGSNPIRPATVTNISGNPPVDTPFAFLAALENTQPGAEAVYTDWLSGVTTSDVSTDADRYRGGFQADNLSVFIIEPGGTEGVFAVKAVWEVDLIATTNPEGTYVSVRRYETTNLTDYYDIFYEGAGIGSEFRPLCVFYERAARAIPAQPTSLNSTVIAENIPYYYLFWPDPSTAVLEDAVASSYAESSLQYHIQDMGNRTQFFFVVPMFPSLF